MTISEALKQISENRNVSPSYGRLLDLHAKLKWSSSQGKKLRDCRRLLQHAEGMLTGKMCCLAIEEDL